MKLFIVFVSLVSWYIAESQTYIMALEKYDNCGNVSVRSIIDVQYNYSHFTKDGNGYMNFLRSMDWEDNYEITGDMYQKRDGQWVKNDQISWPKTKYCIFLFSDMVAVPIMKKFTHFDDHCPVKRGKIEIYTGKVISRYQPLFPYGCWKMVVHFEKPDTGEVEYVCAIFHSVEKLKSNHTTC